MNRIFFFEDQQEDAERLSSLIVSLLPAPDSETVEKVTLEAFFRKHQITWVKDYNLAQMMLQQETYDIYILDLEFSNYGMVGMQLVDLIRSRKEQMQPQIWIYSIMGHFEQKMIVQYHVDEFFSKSGDQTRLCNHLRQALGLLEPESVPGEKELSIYIGKDKPRDVLQLDRLICAVMHSGACEVRLLNPGTVSSERRKYYRISNLTNLLLEGMSLGKYPSLHQIAKGVIINENMINRVLRDGKKLQLEMYQEAGTFTVGNGYMDSIQVLVGRSEDR